MARAQLKSFIPGKVYFQYQSISAAKKADTTTEEERQKAEFDSQCWLLCQCFEVISDKGIRPLGLADIELLKDGLRFNAWVTAVFQQNFNINFLDKAKSFEETEYFEIEGKDLKIRVNPITTEKAIAMQRAGQKDTEGIELTKWLICECVTINKKSLLEKQLLEELDFAVAALLANKIQLILGKYQADEMLFSLPDIPAGVSEIFAN
jgi:hypothetical protein